jgi:penicillin-binding protein 1C
VKRLKGFVLACAALGGLLWGADRLYPLPLPDDSAYAAVVTDQRGEPLRAFAGRDGVWRYSTTPEQVSPLYLEALVAYEDRWFYQHPGVNPLALARALGQAITNRRVVSGGSTLTMQVARILDPHSRTIGGKMKQMLRALQLEWHLSKQEILTLYLNHAPFGGNLEGVEAASWAYLQKPARHLSHAEAALLVVLPQSPSRFRPDRHAGRAQAARDKVLTRMAQFEIWSPQTVAEARQEVVAAAAPRQPVYAPLLARRLLQQQGGKRLRTTLDGDLQRALEGFISDHMARFPEGTSAAVLVVDNRDMAAKAYVGSADFGNAKRYGYVDMAQAIRSPGSTLKPFLYGLALDDGLIHSHSLLSDTPRLVGDYRPGNFDQGFNGPVSAQEALQRSLNLPAVQLLEHYGPRRFSAALQNGGLPLMIPGDGQPNLAMILGGAGTDLESLVGAYAALGREGKAATPRYLPDQPLEERHLLSPGAAWIVYRMLADNPRGEFAPSRHFLRRGSLAWKTGTSYGFRDAWAIGVNARYTIGVWVGRPDGTPSPGQYGAVTAAPLLFAVASQLPGSGQNITQPNSVSRAAVCWPLGTRKSEQLHHWCHREQRAWLLSDTAPPTLPASPTESWYTNPAPVWLDRENGLRLASGCGLAERGKQKQIALWPRELEPWLPLRHRRRALLPPISPRCPYPGIAAGGDLSITGIEEGSRFRPAGQKGRLPVLPLSTIGGTGSRYWFVNGRFHHETGPDQLAYLALEKSGPLQVAVVDSAGNVDRVEVTVLSHRK